MIPPLPQPEGAEAIAMMARIQIPVLLQVAMLMTGMIAIGFLLIWWKLHALNMFRPQRLDAAPLHRLDPSSYRDDTGKTS